MAFCKANTGKGHTWWNFAGRNPDVQNIDVPLNALLSEEVFGKPDMTAW